MRLFAMSISNSDALQMATPGFPNLKRKSSRWRTLSGKPLKPGEQREDEYNLLLYHKSLKVDKDDPESFGLNRRGHRRDISLVDEPNATDVSFKPSTSPDAMELDKPEPPATSQDAGPNDLKDIGVDISWGYETGIDKKVTRVALKGNEHSRSLIAEMDELIALARTVYTEPGDLTDWMQELYAGTYRDGVLQRDGSKKATLKRSLEWCESWAEVRYRFLNHYLRDDPAHWSRLEGEFYQSSGDHANLLIHQGRGSREIVM
ncbi:hypothetical protein F5B20DRAFT_70962 [Whalleya microplaca]|nr:hypothetical protein F5B20DRAFT_70962 [Whalleya microplaca]